MKRFYSSETLSADIIDAALLSGGKALDGDMDSLSDVKSLQFNEHTVIFSILKAHSEYGHVVPILLKHFLVFQTSLGVFLPLSKTSIQDSKLLEFLQVSLAGIKLHLDVGANQEEAEHGKWSTPDSGNKPKSHPFELMEVIAAREIGLIEAMYGRRILKNFEFSLDVVRRRKKDDVEDVAPCIWIDKILQDPDTGHISTRINILSRSGMKYRVISSVVANGTMQDTKKLTEWIVSVVPSVVDRKGLGELVKELLRDAFPRIDTQLWIKGEGWLRSDDSVTDACVCGQELLTTPGTDLKRFYVDVSAPRLSQSGTLDGWNRDVLNPVSKNYILTGAIQLGLAASMIDFLPGLSSCIFNFFGGAGRGKTLLLSTVASLYGNTTAPGQSSVGRGGRSIIETFGSTQRALQAKSQQASLGPMLIDEIGSNSFGDLDRYVYETGNGASRTRLSSNGDVQESPPKALFVMTTGEEPIMSLVSRNARQGVFDRGVDINIGGGDVSFEGQDADEYVFLPDDIKKAVSAGIPSQYGTVAPAFIQALLSEMSSQNWEAELHEIRQDLVGRYPSYVSNGGAGRVLTRFALAVLAGRVALRNKVFSEQYVDEIDLFNGVIVCADLWVTTRWNHLYRLSEALISQKRILQSSPRSGLQLYRHQEWSGNMPTLMISKEYLEEVFPGVGQMEKIGKQFKEDRLIVRADVGRNTVGKRPHYHLKTAWLKDHQIEWSEDREAFINVEPDGN